LNREIVEIERRNMRIVMGFGSSKDRCHDSVRIKRNLHHGDTKNTEEAQKNRE
jgi:hypothetical protein